MITQNTRESALRREEFHALLQQWLDESFDSVAGNPESHAGPDWLWVRHGGQHYYLGAASTRDGVRDYMRLVSSTRGDPEWAPRRSRSKLRTRVLLGRERRLIDGFEFFQYLAAR